LPAVVETPHGAGFAAMDEATALNVFAAVSIRYRPAEAGCSEPLPVGVADWARTGSLPLRATARIRIEVKTVRDFICGSPIC
jgi:hypothetical protein